ncbi:hypothetical protein GYMLUDRAFT_428393 [Collybiopsis luxurians FD-317 M1]|uniref:Uncharacterized protein n=1 Tax=Collybiopsis luxurians FD-317 M1 TaxID=944289 RepID=A0A0D0C7B4_9AGAR|nr:hypothetical protein GYMLUDRAFT_428393 [Collybiopsis luxurians FD-317 M1]
MFSPKRSLVFFILFGSLTLEFCTSATASAVPSTTDEPSTRIAPRPGMLVSKPNIARLSAVPVWDVLNLPMRITEDTSPTNDTDNGDSLTDTGASPPRPTRLSIALTVCAVGQVVIQFLSDLDLLSITVFASCAFIGSFVIHLPNSSTSAYARPSPISLIASPLPLSFSSSVPVTCIIA